MRVTRIPNGDMVVGRDCLGEVSVAGCGDEVDESDEDFIAAVNTKPAHAWLRAFTRSAWHHIMHSGV